MTKIVIADPIHPDAIELLNSTSFDIVDVSPDKSRLTSEVVDADAIIVRSATKVRGDFLSSCKQLKFVARSGVGLDNIDLDKCKERKITVVNSPEGPTRSVAELALGLMIAAFRKFGIVVPGTKAGEWPKREKGNEVFGKTLGIIGSGAIGGQLAKYAIALGMEVLAYDIVEYDELKSLEGFQYVDLETLFTQSDVISTHVPLLDATHHMVDKDAINKMKQGVILVNTSRGGIIDEKALYEGIQEGKVGGAGLDVFENEPVGSGYDLVNHPLVISTPHIGAQTAGASRNNSMVVVQKLIDFFN